MKKYVANQHTSFFLSLSLESSNIKVLHTEIMPYLIYLIFLAFATAVIMVKQAYVLNIHLLCMGIIVIIGQIAIFCFINAAINFNSEKQHRNAIKTLHYGATFSLIVCTTLVYLYKNVLHRQEYLTTAIYFLGTWFAITLFDSIFKFFKVGILNSKKESVELVHATRKVTMVTLAVCMFGYYLFSKYVLNIDVLN